MIDALPLESSPMSQAPQPTREARREQFDSLRGSSMRLLVASLYLVEVEVSLFQEHRHGWGKSLALLQPELSQRLASHPLPCLERVVFLVYSH